MIIGTIKKEIALNMSIDIFESKIVMIMQKIVIVYVFKVSGKKVLKRPLSPAYIADDKIKNVIKIKIFNIFLFLNNLSFNSKIFFVFIFCPNFKSKNMHKKNNKNKKGKTKKIFFPKTAKYSKISFPDANPAPMIDPIIKNDVFKTVM